MTPFWWGFFTGISSVLIGSAIILGLLVMCVNWTLVLQEAERDMMREWGMPEYDEERPEPAWDLDNG